MIQDYLRARIAWRVDTFSEKLRDLVSNLRVQMLPKRAVGSALKKQRILIIDEMLPDPRFGAGYPRAADIMRAVIDAGWQVTMYPVIATRDQYRDVRAQFGTSVVFEKSFGESGLRRLLQENVGQFDTVLVSRPATMRAYSRQLAAVPSFADHLRCVYDAEAIFSVRERDRRLLFQSPMTESEFEAALSDEISVTAGAEAIITVTFNEAEIYKERVKVPVHVVSHSMPVRPEGPGFANRHNFLFVGRSSGPSDQSPNVDSLIWFIDKIMPIIDRQMGDNYQLLIAGLADSDLINRLKSDRIVFKGVVDDLTSLYDKSRVFIAPTRFAAGLPMKVTEAAGMGIPCVTTTLLAKQMDFAPDREVIAADTAELFAAGCSLIYSDEVAWSRIRANALSKVAADYNPQSFATSVLSALS